MLFSVTFDVLDMRDGTNVRKKDKTQKKCTSRLVWRGYEMNPKWPFVRRLQVHVVGSKRSFSSGGRKECLPPQQRARFQDRTDFAGPHHLQPSGPAAVL